MRADTTTSAAASAERKSQWIVAQISTAERGLRAGFIESVGLQYHCCTEMDRREAIEAAEAQHAHRQSLSPPPPLSVLFSFPADTTVPPLVTLTQDAFQLDWQSAWYYTDRNPKLWSILRRTLRAYSVLCIIALATHILYLLLLTRTPPGAAATSSPTASNQRGSYRRLPASSWWLVRVAMLVFRYGGQWTHYMVLQVVGLVWYQGLFNEAWLMRMHRYRCNAAAGGRSIDHREQALKSGCMAAVLSPFSSPPHKMKLAKEADVAQGNGGMWIEDAAGAVFSTCNLVVLGVWRASFRLMRMAFCLCSHKYPRTHKSEWILGEKAHIPPRAAHSAVEQQQQQQQQRRQEAARLTSSTISNTAAHGAGGGDGKAETSLTHRQRQHHQSLETALHSLSETLFKAVATFLYSVAVLVVQKWLAFCWLGTAIGLAMNSLLYSFYVFDYAYLSPEVAMRTERRVHRCGTMAAAIHPTNSFSSLSLSPAGARLTEQLRQFEEHWLYFLTYGLGTTLFSSVLAALVGPIPAACVTSVLYGWQVVCSAFAHPIKAPFPVPVFSTWFRFVNSLSVHYSLVWRLAVVLALLYIPYIVFVR